MIARLFGTTKFLDMLGMPRFWFTLAIIIGVIVALVFCIKYFKKGGKFVLLTIFILGMIAISTYSGIQLNYYYNARGGIYGAITGIFKPNEVNVVENLSYEFKNVELTQDHDNIYSANIIIGDVMKLDKDVNYGVYVNDTPCDYVENASNYVLAKYTYKFYDNDLREILEDTLTFRFAFYTDSTYLSLSTNGGSEAVKYWNYYLNKNLFVVNIKPNELLTSEDLTYGNGDISAYAYAKFVLKDKSIYKVFKKGDLITPPTEDAGLIDAWLLNGEVTDLTDYRIRDNVEFVARYLEEVDITFDRTFANNSWDTISKISKYIVSNKLSAEQITAMFGWNVGDVKPERINNENVEIVILDFNHDNLTGSTNKAAITFGLKNVLSKDYKDTFTGMYQSWDNSSLRDEMTVLLGMLPEDLQQAISAVDKKSYTYDGSIVTTSDKLFLPSFAEVSYQTYGADGEGSIYEYFKDQSKLYKFLMPHQLGANWALRSTSYLGMFEFGIVGAGMTTFYDGNSSIYVSFCFCI